MAISGSSVSSVPIVRWGTEIVKVAQCFAADILVYKCTTIDITFAIPWSFLHFRIMFNSLKEVINLLAFITTQTISERCSSFTFGSDNTDLISSTYFEAGARVSVSNLFETIDTNDLPAFCRIEVKITTNTTANSTAATEIWLPEKWNGRLLTIGNGGFAGGGNLT